MEKETGNSQGGKLSAWMHIPPRLGSITFVGSFLGAGLVQMLRHTYMYVCVHTHTHTYMTEPG